MDITQRLPPTLTVLSQETVGGCRSGRVGIGTPKKAWTGPRDSVPRFLCAAWALCLQRLPGHNSFITRLDRLYNSEEQKPLLPNTYACNVSCIVLRVQSTGRQDFFSPDDLAHLVSRRSNLIAARYAAGTLFRMGLGGLTHSSFVTDWSQMQRPPILPPDDVDLD